MGASANKPGLETRLERKKREEEFHYVSFSDMVQHPLYHSWINKEDFGNGIDEVTLEASETNNAPIAAQNDDNRITVSYAKPPRNVLNALLHVHGMDINIIVEESMCWHRRPSDGLPVHTLRFSGKVRKDKNYRLLTNKG